MKRNILTQEELKQLASYEVPFEGDPSAAYACTEPYPLQPEDLLAALLKLKELPHAVWLREWFAPLTGTLEGLYRYPWQQAEPEETFGLSSLNDRFRDLFERFCERANDKEEEFTDLIFELQELLKEREKPLSRRSFTKEEKTRFLAAYSQGRLPREETEKQLLKRFCEELPDEYLTRKVRARLLINGTVFPKDEEEAESLLSALLKEKDDPDDALLYAKLWLDGPAPAYRPDREKALPYLLQAAAWGKKEARLLLGDLYRKDLNGVKEKRLPWAIYQEVYQSELRRFAQGQDDTWLAESTYRLALMETAEFHYESAFSHLLLAEYASERKLACGQEVSSECRPVNLRKKRTELSEKCFSSLLTSISLPFGSDLYWDLRLYDCSFEMHAKQLKNGTYRVTLKCLPKGSEQKAADFLVCIPEAHYCARVPEIVLKGEKGSRILTDRQERTDEELAFIFEAQDWDGFYLNGKEVFSLQGDWHYRIPKEKIG